MPGYKLAAALVVAAAMSSGIAVAQAADQPFSLTAPHVSAQPVIDGTLNDAAWNHGGHASLAWDFTYQRPATEKTDVYILSDATTLYIAFDARQHVAITANQRTNDLPLSSDDSVRVTVWPQGDIGFTYSFSANPLGTRTASSSENTAYAPQWTAVASINAHGYVVTMAIPLRIMRGTSSTAWRVQFDRTVRVTNENPIWAYRPGQPGVTNVLYAGYLNGVVASGANRPKPRLQFYGLGQAASASADGSHARAGMDFSLPVTPTASLVGTVYPDYSNVDLDQQSIAPTAFPRRYAEVRPFFTQGANFFNGYNCNDCIDYPLLYTPAIPTPRDGFALEGTQGRLSFAGFDSISAGRADTAQSLFYQTGDHRYSFQYQRQSLSEPAFYDLAQVAQIVGGNTHNFNAYVTLGGESGTPVSVRNDGRYREYGFNVYTPKSGAFAAYHDVGSQFAPVDTFVTQNDLRGPSLYVFRNWDYGATRFIQNLSLSEDLQRYVDHTGALANGVSSSQISISTRKLYSVSLTSGSQYIHLPDTSSPSGYDAGLTNQNGITLSYGSQTSYPQSISYNLGRFGAGYLHSIDRNANLRFLRRGTVTLELYDTDYAPDIGSRKLQWLERLALAYPLGPDTSIALGLRRIFGTAPTFFTTPSCINAPVCKASNVSFAFHRRHGADEIYLVYGDPNAVVTRPALILKYVHYIGAQKGT